GARRQVAGPERRGRSPRCHGRDRERQRPRSRTARPRGAAAVLRRSLDVGPPGRRGAPGPRGARPVRTARPRTRPARAGPRRAPRRERAAPDAREVPAAAAPSRLARVGGRGRAMIVRPRFAPPAATSAPRAGSRRLAWSAGALLALSAAATFAVSDGSAAVSAVAVRTALLAALPLAFLASLPLRRAEPNARFPYGSRRHASITVLFTALALATAARWIP